MKLVAGLGNIGDKYCFTRHNAGFMVVDKMAMNHDVAFKEDKKLKCFIGKFKHNGEDIILIKPTTFMNLSGDSVQLVMNYYKIDISDVIIVYDDLSLEVGKIRFRPSGSDGGHNGIKNIIAQLGHDSFHRIKVGVGEKPKGYDLVDYVLGHFSKEELAIMQDSLVKVDGAVNLMLEGKVDAAMNEYNKKVEG